MEPQRLYDVLDATWPAARQITVGPWCVRDGQGGGKRVSSATTTGAIEDTEIAQAEAALRELNQDQLFMIRTGQAKLDAALAARGYQVIDPVVAFAAPVAQLTDQPIPRVTALPHWEPLAIVREIWAAGGIGPARVDVMHRVTGPKTAILGRKDDKPAGAAFVAVHDGVAMAHAIEVLPHQRRKGMAQWFMRAAAVWAEAQGAHTIAVVCVRENTAATALYSSLGMQDVGEYHYRLLPASGEPA